VLDMNNIIKYTLCALACCMLSELYAAQPDGENAAAQVVEQAVEYVYPKIEVQPLKIERVGIGIGVEASSLVAVAGLAAALAGIKLMYDGLHKRVDEDTRTAALALECADCKKEQELAPRASTQLLAYGGALIGVGFLAMMSSPIANSITQK
jgi:hypothetical protein